MAVEIGGPRGGAASGEASEVVRTIFGTPMLMATWPECDEVNEGLRRLILDTELREPSVEQSNRGGWQSPKTLATSADPVVRTLLGWIDVGVYLLTASLIGEEEVDRLGRKWGVSAWANVSRKGDFNGSHHHVGGFWSGVYYVSAGGDGEQVGAIAFRSPGQGGVVASNIEAPRALQNAFRQELRLRPHPGLMLLFPSWVEHWVEPHAGPEPRISVAFDISFGTNDET